MEHASELSYRRGEEASDVATNSPQSLAQGSPRGMFLWPELQVTNPLSIGKLVPKRYGQGAGSSSYTILELLKFCVTLCIRLRICIACLNNCRI